MFSNHSFSTITFTALLLITVSLLSCTSTTERNQKEITDALSDTLTASSESWGVTVSIFEEDLPKVTIRAGYAVNTQEVNKNTSRFKDSVFVTVWDSTTTRPPRSTITCDEALYNSKEAVFECFGGVIVRSPGDKILRTEYLKWEQENGEIFSDRFVTITTKDDSLTGYGITGAEDLSSYTLTKVKGTVETD